MMASFASSNLIKTPLVKPSEAARAPKIQFPGRSASFASGINRNGGGWRAMAVVKFQGTRKRDEMLSDMIEKKITEAKEVCEGNNGSDECKVAWDEVEEVSQAKADLRRKMEKEDPLESFCSEHPETDECRIYED